MTTEKSYVEQYMNTNEPILFESAYFHTEKYVYDFNNFSYKKRQNAYVFNLIIAVVLLITSPIYFFNGDTFLGLSSIICAVLCFAIPVFTFKKAAKNQIYSGYSQNNLNRYKFYQDCFVHSENFSVSAVPYSIVAEAAETAEYFYIFINKNQAHVIPKSSFILNTPEEMRKLLTMKLGSKFIVHCK